MIARIKKVKAQIERNKNASAGLYNDIKYYRKQVRQKEERIVELEAILSAIDQRIKAQVSGIPVGMPNSYQRGLVPAEGMKVSKGGNNA